MEHRAGRRQPILHHVTLYYRDQPFSRCRMRDFSLGGVFVEVPGTLPRGALVSLEWYVPRAGWRRLKGLVVHQAAQGVGLMFCDEHAARVLMDDQAA